MNQPRTISEMWVGLLEKLGWNMEDVLMNVKFDGNYPRWFFKEDVSTVWKDDRRSDKSYSHEKSGKFKKSTSVFQLKAFKSSNTEVLDFRMLVVL
ncbi:hypothetical protein Tco_1427998 [Tanacetum coccineum]